MVVHIVFGWFSFWWDAGRIIDRVPGKFATVLGRLGSTARSLAMDHLHSAMGSSGILCNCTVKEERMQRLLHRIVTPALNPWMLWYIVAALALFNIADAIEHIEWDNDAHVRLGPHAWSNGLSRVYFFAMIPWSILGIIAFAKMFLEEDVKPKG